MDTKELVNKNLVKKWTIGGLIWLTIFPLVGALVSIKFHHPDFLSDDPWFTFGRLRPVHVNGVIFGAFSTPFIALAYYMVPHLCGRPLYRAEWGTGLLWLWNIFLLIGSLSLLLGYNLGLEAAEFEWPMNILRFLVLGGLTIQILGTIFKRREPRVYVSLWYLSAALIWTLFNLILGNAILPYSDISGTNSAAMHGLYIHYIVGLWLTPAGLAVIYYFLPLSVREPLFSHKLSLLGFWSLAFFYPFVGTHHYLFSPIPYWTQTISIVMSMMLIIPVWTVSVNFFGTAKGKWGEFLGGNHSDHYAAKFLMLGAVYYLLGCFQGSVEALRRMQELTHFNDFVIAHSHLTVFGSMIMWIVGGLYYVWPRITGRHLWSAKLASWHLWLTVVGFTVMALGLTAQGFIQGTMLENGVNFVSSLEAMRSWWMTRTLGGIAMDVGLALMVLNFYLTAKRGLSEKETKISAPKECLSLPLAKTKRPHWSEAPSTIILIGCMGFFFLAVFSQGIAPLVMAETRTIHVEEAVTNSMIQVKGYSQEELRGRQVYIREGCWYCHSQYIRPVTGEAERWGPVSQIGEYAYDQPHLFSTRRIGPDLTRIGRKYGDDWHIAHHWNPRAIVPMSIMPRFPWLFEQKKGADPVLNQDGQFLISYLQRLGTSIGDWREGFVSTRLTRMGPEIINPRQATIFLEKGQRIYQKYCEGCHGVHGNGKGPAAVFLDPKPRDFTMGIFKFHSTPGQNSLPTDADLFATISHGLWGTAMPPWYSLPEYERIAVIQYIKTFSERWKKEVVQASIPPSLEPRITISSLEKGGELFKIHCVVCHGQQGKGDGPLAGKINDVWGYPIQPANFHLPAGLQGGVKLGHDSRHIFVTIMTGVGGDPMPPFKEQLTKREIWNVTHYVQSLRIHTQENHLLQAGMNPQKTLEIRKELWANLSQAAEAGEIDQTILNT